MKDLVFITGNQHKAEYLAKWLGIPIPHQKASVDELQSLDLKEVVAHKARGAYQLVGRPVLVEDIALTFHGLGRLPGTYIKWFLEELQPAGLCKIVQPFADKTATASIMYGLYDGKELRTFEAHVAGTITSEPRVSDAAGWNTATSWNSVFVPDGHSKTYGEMSDEELKPISHRAKAIEKLRVYLDTRSLRR
jgi:non-canonical purine NTP pyrophosphatase (RdgB/HAM1 family)